MEVEGDQIPPFFDVTLIPDHIYLPDRPGVRNGVGALLVPMTLMNVHMPEGMRGVGSHRSYIIWEGEPIDMLVPVVLERDPWYTMLYTNRDGLEDWFDANSADRWEWFTNRYYLEPGDVIRFFKEERTIMRGGDVDLVHGFRVYHLRKPIGRLLDTSRHPTPASAHEMPVLPSDSPFPMPPSRADDICLPSPITP